MWPSGARRAVVWVCVVTLLGTGCGTVRDFFGQPEVFDTGIEPLTLELDAPAYSAAVRSGLLVRNGEERVVLRRASTAAWFPDGRVLAGTRRVPQEIVEIDPATGEIVGEYGMPEGYGPGPPPTNPTTRTDSSWCGSAATRRPSCPAC